MKDNWSKLSIFKRKSVPEKALNLDEVELDVDYCRELLCEPSSQNFATLNNYLNRCTTEWLQSFLECNALNMMLGTLEFMGLRKNASFADAVIELEIVRSIKLILNTKTGIQYLTDTDPDLVESMVLSKL